MAAVALKDREPAVRRRAAEALVRMGQSPDKPSLLPVADVYGLLNDTDRFVRWAGRIAIEHTPRADWKDRVLAETNPLGAIEGMLAWVRTAGTESLQPVLDKQFAMLKQTNLSAEDRLRLYRTFMYTTSEVKGGLSAAQREQLNAAIIGQFPAPPGPNSEALNRELALMLGYAGQPAAIAKILAAIPKTNTNQELQLHYLYALRMIKQGWTPADKAQLAEVLGRAAKWRGGAQFINFVGQFFDSVSELYATDDEKTLLYEKAPDFSPLTPTELAEIQARQAAAAAAGRGGRGGGGGRGERGAGGAARRTNRRSRAQPSGDVRRNGVSAAAGARRRGRPQSVRGQLRVVPQVRLGRQRPRGRQPEPVGVGRSARRRRRSSKRCSSPSASWHPSTRPPSSRRPTARRSPGWCCGRRARTVSILTTAGAATDVPKAQIKCTAEDENVDHAGLARRHDRPQHHAQPGRVPGGRATGRRRQRRAVG